MKFLTKRKRILMIIKNEDTKSVYQVLSRALDDKRIEIELIYSEKAKNKIMYRNYDLVVVEVLDVAEKHQEWRRIKEINKLITEQGKNIPLVAIGNFSDEEIKDCWVFGVSHIAMMATDLTNALEKIAQWNVRYLR